MEGNRILLLATVGGFVPQFQMENVKLLQQMGMKVHYAANFKEPFYHLEEKELSEAGICLHQVDIHKSPFHVWQNKKAYDELVKVIKQEKINYIHCHTPVGGVLGRLLGKRFGKEGLKVIYTAHGFHFYKGAPWKNWCFYYPVERYLARYTDALITVNQEDRRRAEDFRLRMGGQAYQIPGVGIRTERLAVIEGAGEQFRRENDIPADAFHMVSVGEVNRNKNHQIVLEAMQRWSNEEIYYTVCGSGTEEEKLKRMVRDKKMEQKVRFLGYRDEIASVLDSADCFLFPSIREGLGMAALEAMALGIPVLAAENRGTKEYVVDEENGYLCHYKDADAFAKRIYALYKDSTGRKRMGENARKMAERFSKEASKEAMEQIYRKIL